MAKKYLDSGLDHKVDYWSFIIQAPVISRIIVKGSTVTVKYTRNIKNAQDYDVVLSDTLTKTNGQKRLLFRIIM